ncbi:MAG: site-2 protease family protein [Candidatus Levybacteria bacterium]|nr:site-2 protease family protein [Candidatus Levybacteria bacterium]
MLLTILVFIVMLSVLVLIHELGHFLVAKKFGIKVEEFGFGFPPRVFGKRIGETLYSFNALPIGGFVKLYGEDEAGSGRINSKSEARNSKHKDLDRAFFARPIYQRMLVVVAGVTMNFLLAVAIITYLITFEGIPVQEASVSITEIAKNSPASLSGLQKGDVIEKIGNVEIKNTQVLITETRKHLGENLSITIRRGNELQTIEVTPRKDFPEGEGPIGVAISQKVEFQKYPFPQSLYQGTRQALNDSWLVVVGFKNVMIELFTRLTVPQGVAGPIGMAQLTGEFVRVGPSAVLALVYTLSLTLAVLNILPIPALDGGRLFFILIEAVTRRKMNARFEAYAHLIGLVLLLSFLALVSYKDILRIITGQSILPQ